jgi:hypothetical protein
MNNLSLIIGIVIIVLSIILIFVGGWEKFHLQRENNAWLALFIVGWISFVAGAGLILLGIVSNKKSKVSLDKLSVKTPTGVIPLTSVVVPMGSSASPMGSAASPMGSAASPMGSLTSGPPNVGSVSTPMGSLTSGPPVVSSALGVSSMSSSVSGLITGPPSIYDLPPVPISSKSKLGGGVIEYQPLELTNYPASLKGGLFD